MKKKWMVSFQMSRASMCLTAWIAGGALLLASNYCVCEAFSSRHTDSSHHQHAPTSSHHEESPSNHEVDPCCSTLQAVVTPHSTFLLVAGPQLLFQEVPLETASIVRLVDLSLAPTGLSPPAREPTSARPFYRTTFASHAPPVCFA